MTQNKNNLLEKYKKELESVITKYFENAEITLFKCKNENKENKKLDNKAFIYFAFHKKDNKLFYIGYTTKILEDRLNQKIQANEFRLKLFDYYREEFCKKNISLKEFDATIISKAIEDDVIIYYICSDKENITQQNSNSVSKELKVKIKNEIKKENKIPNSL